MSDDVNSGPTTTIAERVEISVLIAAQHFGIKGPPRIYSEIERVQMCVESVGTEFATASNRASFGIKRPASFGLREMGGMSDFRCTNRRGWKNVTCFKPEVDQDSSDSASFA